MKKFILPLVFLLVVVYFSSCKKEDDIQKEVVVSKTTDLKVPENFTWKSTKNITLNVNVPDNGNQLFDVISVFTENPYSAIVPIAKGSAKAGTPFTTILNIPSYKQEIWVQRIKPNGEIDQQIVSTTSQNLSVYFANKKKSSLKSLPYQTNYGPGTSANVVITQTSGTITIKNSQVYIINSNFNGTINWEPWNGGGTLKTNNNVTITSNDMGNNCKIEVLPNSKLTINSQFNMYSNSSLYVYTNAEIIINSINSQQSTVKYFNYGNFNVNSWYAAINGSIENYAFFKTTQNTSTSALASIKNYGDLIFENNFELNKPFSNFNTLYVMGNFTANSIVLENQCKIIVDKNMSINATSLVSEPASGTSIIVGEKFFGSSTAIVKLRDKSLLLAKNMEYYGAIQGNVSTNSVKVTGVFVNMWGSIIKSNIELSGPGSTPPQGMTLQGGATYVSNNNITNYIPSSECSPGLGFIPIVDIDGDGIADSQDDYPNDPTKAFNNYTPSPTSFGTLLFEDLWPYKGDYDFNDLVINYKVNNITNAANKVVEMVLNFKVKAKGGSISNGFGIQFDNLTPNQVQSVNGGALSNGHNLSIATNGTENNQSKAVVIVFDKTSHLLNPINSNFINTEPNSVTVQAYPVDMLIKFTSPLDVNLLGNAPFNYFIFRTQIRGHEVHGVNNMPTSMMIPSLLGSGDDASNGTNYFRTSNNLPWAISVPEEIDYPYEKVDITGAFTYFATWAQSGGTTKSDWYKNIIGYRNNSLIYHYSSTQTKK